MIITLTDSMYLPTYYINWEIVVPMPYMYNVNANEPQLEQKFSGNWEWIYICMTYLLNLEESSAKTQTYLRLNPTHNLVLITKINSTHFLI